MTKYYFGKRSMRNFRTLDPRLQLIMREALEASPYDFALIEGHRSVRRQQELYAQGKTFIDGISRKGKHNHSPSLAVDIVPWPIADEWENPFRFYVIAGIILSTAKRLGYNLRWGGDWDGDGSRADQRLHDLPHFELVD